MASSKLTEHSDRCHPMLLKRHVRLLHDSKVSVVASIKGSRQYQEHP